MIERNEHVSPTQPFPTRPPPISHHSVSPDDAWGALLVDKWICRSRLAKLRNGPIYTPPTSGGTAVPGNAGGSNWGGIAIDPGRGIAIDPGRVRRRRDGRLPARSTSRAARSSGAGGSPPAARPRR